MAKTGEIVRLVGRTIKMRMEGQKYREGFIDGYHAALMELADKVDVMSSKFGDGQPPVEDDS